MAPGRKARLRSKQTPPRAAGSGDNPGARVVPRGLRRGTPSSDTLEEEAFNVAFTFPYHPDTFRFRNNAPYEICDIADFIVMSRRNRARADATLRMVGSFVRDFLTFDRANVPPIPYSGAE